MTDYEKMEELKNLMGAEALLEEIIVSMSSDELKEMVNWIMRNYDIEI
jgi:hypothetical protein